MKKNIYNIKSNYNFLESLVHFILKKYGADPIFLSKITILLPSRRSCRVIKEIFLKQSSTNAVILPNIKAIGDFDVEEISFNSTDLFLSHDAKINQISDIKYRCLLIDEIRKFNQKTHFFGKNIMSNQLDLIASNLDDFLQEIEREDLDLDNLENIDDTDLAGHKQKILNFLRHFGSNWRNILQKNNIHSKTSYQKKIIDLNSQFLAKFKSDFPIFIAGSTGSLKATAHLIKTISNLENGFVFLYGLDKNLKADLLKEIGENHPQFMLKRLLEILEITPNQIVDIEFKQFKQTNENLGKLLNYTFLPARKTDIWTKINDLEANSIENLTLIECKNNFDEATIIALIMVKYLEEQGKNIALVTSDKNLALLVKEILYGFEINIDNSKNNNLEKSEIASYLAALAILFNKDFRVSNLLTILKNKITRAGFSEDFYEDNLKLFELKILRKNFSLRSMAAIREKVLEFENEDLTNWFFKICEILDIFGNAKNENNFLKLMRKNLEAARYLSRNEDGIENLPILSGFEEFADFVEEFAAEAPFFEIENVIYHKILKQFLASYNFEKKQNHHPRLHILSPIEARIMNYDVMIVANLNDGEFIAQVKTQNWLSRKMRLDFGLSDLNRRIGISAFDFCNYLGNKKVFLTRSLSSNNAPTTKLRFLLKLETLLKATNSANQLDGGKYWHFLLLHFNYPSSLKLRWTSPPLPANPAVGKRLRHISVTDIGKWIRDPYYIYAKRILQLRPLNKIDEEASFANFGNFVHEVLENFVKNYGEIAEKNRLEILLNYGKEYFPKQFAAEESHLLWWSRFENIAQWFIKNEEKNREFLHYSQTEIALRANISGVEITTKIDRINFYKDGSFEIIDYKTGKIPSDTDIAQGLEPQLAMEAVIFLMNKNLNLELLKSLQYYSLKGRDQNKIKEIEKNPENTANVIKAAQQGVRELIAIFNDSGIPFYSCPNFEIYEENDYHHLARIDDV